MKLYFLFVEPACLEFWIQVVKQGGLLCIVHKASVFPKWEPEHQKLQDIKLWEPVWISENPVPYLPSLDVKGTDTAKIYIYKKL